MRLLGVEKPFHGGFRGLLNAQLADCHCTVQVNLL